MDAAKLTDHWRRGSEEDLAAAKSLLDQGHLRHALFFAHLAIEKLLKAHVTRATRDLPPRIHDLLRLAALAELDLTEARRAFLARFQRYCQEGRYPDQQPAPPTLGEAEAAMGEAEETLRWLRSLLS